MGSITCIDLPENFSFSCYELDCSIEAIFDDDKESYIEIDLDQTPNSKELEFRISFSSLPRTEISGQIASDQIFDQGLILPFHDRKPRDSPDGGSVVEKAMRVSTDEISSCRKKNVQVVKRKVKFCETVDVRPQQDGNRSKNRQLVGGTRKQSKIVTALNGGINKFFIKLRSGNVISALMSFIKSYHSFSHQSNGRGSDKRTHKTIKIYPRLSNPFNRWWPQKNNIKIIINNNIRNNGRTKNYNNNDVNLSFKFNNMEINSSSSSTNSSPIRRVSLNGRTSNFERENSIRAAIDYCKQSPSNSIDFSHYSENVYFRQITSHNLLGPKNLMY